MNAHESDAMWKLYTTTNEAIAVQTRYSVLHDSLPEDTYLGVVKYIDYESEWMPEGNTMWPFIHKRKSFEHEREVRAVQQNLPIKDKRINKIPNPDAGKLVETELTSLVEAVYISPTSPGWFVDLVLDATLRYGYKFQLVQSGLAKAPEF